MKVMFKGQIVQIITWEQKEKYIFSKTEFGEEPMDLIIVNRIVDREKGIKKFIRKPIVYKEWTLYAGIEMAVKRPHEFKEGDVVNIEISMEVEKNEMSVV